MKKELGIAIVGCGMIGKFHLTALQGVAEFKVIGVWDAVNEVAAGVRDQYGVKVYTSFDELLNDREVDVVDICLPSGAHAEYGVRAAGSGKHVIVEKPIDVTRETAEKLIVSCEEAGVRLAVILQNRFAPSIMRVKEALDRQALGRLLAGEATIKWYREEKYYTSSNWKGTKALDGGGALMNQGIHTVDLLLWFLGEPRSIASLVKTTLHPIEVEDLAVAVVEFKNGALATITGSTALKPGYPERIELYGEKGSIALEGGKIVRWDVEGMDGSLYLQAGLSGSGSSNPGGIPVENHRTQFTAIAAALLQGVEPPVSGREALGALNLILDIYAANGTWVTYD